MPGERVAFLTLDEALAIHARLVERFGGTAGVRDTGLLESALHRPRTGYHRDLAEMSAALFESLLMKHSFLDGNERVAFFATDVFLRMNGWRLDVDDAAAHEFLIARLESADANHRSLLAWIHLHAVRHRDAARRRPDRPE